MTLIQIQSKDNLVNLKNDPKLYYILIIGVLLATVAFALTKDLFTIITFVMGTAAIFFILNNAPKNILVKLNIENIEIDESFVPWVSVDSWVVSNNKNWLEVMIKTTNFTKPYMIFYILAEDPQTKAFLTVLSEKAVYNKALLAENWVHIVMRRLGLR
jgi:hypothetical protein